MHFGQAQRHLGVQLAQRAGAFGVQSRQAGAFERQRDIPHLEQQARVGKLDRCARHALGVVARLRQAVRSPARRPPILAEKSRR